MKKVIALALALVLALSLGVSAFATIVTNITLAPESTAADEYTIISNDLTLLKAGGFDAEEYTWYTNTPAGGAYYIGIATTTDLKNIVVEKDGNVVSAELVAYDPAKYTTSDNKKVWAGIGAEADQYYVQATYKDTANNNADKTVYLDAAGAIALDAAGATASDAVLMLYASATDAIDEYNEAAVADTATPTTLAKKLNFRIMNDYNVYLIKLTIAENYGVAFTEGYFQIKADIVEGRKTTAVKSEKVTVINDVNVWDYDTFTWAVDNEKDLLFDVDDSYSDYKTYLNTYVPAYKNVVIDDTYMDGNAAVVSTTEFRYAAEAGKGVTVAYQTGTITAPNEQTTQVGNVAVVIPTVAASQKGVNFTVEYDRVCSKDKDPWGTMTALAVDFLGKDVIASEATVQVDLPYTNLELLNDFGKKVEEEDIVTYYVLKDGKLAGQFTVDYLKDNWNDQVKFDIALKAGEALGKYEIVLAVPAAGAEENPNTGAESVIGVVAAMAAVSVVAAAAVSLKK